VILADSSVLVAAFASWHELHDAARAELDPSMPLIAWCALETYSVLTRLPPPRRVSARIAQDYLAQFAAPYVTLSAEGWRALVLGLAGRNVSGGASYDALIAVTASEAGSQLVSCDRRALPTYERFGVAARAIV
jgi:predicted nucleic acid-binding protein